MAQIEMLRQYLDLGNAGLKVGKIRGLIGDLDSGGAGVSGHIWEQTASAQNECPEDQSDDRQPPHASNPLARLVRSRRCWKPLRPPLTSLVTLATFMASAAALQFLASQNAIAEPIAPSGVATSSGVLSKPAMR